MGMVMGSCVKQTYIFLSFYDFNASRKSVYKNDLNLFFFKTLLFFEMATLRYAVAIILMLECRVVESDVWH